MSSLIHLATVGGDFLTNASFFNSEQSIEMLEAEFYLFFGGVLFAFALGGFSMIVRGVKGAAGRADL